MKRFIDLKVTDLIYYVKEHKTKIESFEIDKISKNEGIFTGVHNGGGHRDYHYIGFKELQKTRIEKYGSYNSKTVFFANESDAKRYAKAVCVRRLRELVEAAEIKIEDVKNFRKEFFNELNRDWVESEIVKLEKTLS
jgi:hypothetical protein